MLGILMRQSVLTVGREGETAVTIIDVVKRIAMISAPIGLIAFSLCHGTLSWSETQHLANAGLDEWIQHLTNIQRRWLAAHIGGVALFPLLGVTIWWMLPPRGIASGVSKVALTVYVPLYIAVDGVLGIGSSILIHYREGLAPSDRAGVDGAFEALFFAPSAIDWLDQGASIAWEIGALAAALALWRDYGWRVSVPLASAGYLLAKTHFPPFGAIAGLALGIAVWQYLVLKQRAAGQPSSLDPSMP
jgi:hypothetical protein